MAAAAAVCVSPLGSLSASAQPISRATQELTKRVFSDPRITTNTDCGEYKKNSGNEYGVDALCEVRKGQLLEQEGRRLSSQGRQLESKEREIDRTGACLKELVAFKQTSPEMFEKLRIEVGAFTRENACAAATRTRSKPTASARPTAG